jgi:DNA methylase
VTLQLPLFEHETGLNLSPACTGGFEDELRSFCEFGASTIAGLTTATVAGGRCVEVPTYVNEFWTSKQRAAHSLHEISYRACFKPQLPRFFIQRLTEPGETVYDPFMGRGTTLLEAALMERIPMGCDVNPLSAILLRPRLEPPHNTAVAERLASLNLRESSEYPEELLTFYHPETLKAICALKEYLSNRAAAGTLDHVDRWIRMVAVNRLTGHSPGFFSVYTMPPNQAVSVSRQSIINQARQQTPPYRRVPKLILSKTRSLLKECHAATRRRLEEAAAHALLLTGHCSATPEIPSGSVSLVVTSPPFLDVVDYAGDNWLRCWFCGIDPESVPLTVLRKLEEWQAAMTAVFMELQRVLIPGGHIAFEVGEVRGGKVRLEEAVIPCGMAAGLQPRLVLINSQRFTKTANCWGVDNGRKGTNTNRVVVFRKPGD